MKSFGKKIVQVQNRVKACLFDTALLPTRVHVAIFTITVSISDHALAATSTGVTGFFSGFTGAINGAIGLVLTASQLMGVAAVLYGLYNLAKKGMNRGEDIEWSKVLYPVLGGALLTIIFYVIESVVIEGGATKSDMGRNNAAPVKAP